MSDGAGPEWATCTDASEVSKRRVLVMLVVGIVQRSRVGVDGREMRVEKNTRPRFREACEKDGDGLRKVLTVKRFG